MVRRMFEKKPLRLRLDKTRTMGRFRNRCILICFLVAFCWLVLVHRFVTDGHSSQSNDAQTGTLPVLKWQQRDTSQSSVVFGGEKFTSRDALSQADFVSETDECAGRYIYMHDLPREFHEGLLESCESLTVWADMCKETVNMGFGQAMGDLAGVFSDSGWYSTNQFNLEVIFHHRVRHYKCLTSDSSKANAVFVPFYSGFEVMPHLWNGADIAHRDQVPYALVNWLTSRPEWSRLYGHDHFMIGGRVTWDFRRKTDEERDWGNKLLILDPVQNMSTLTIEASPWHSNDFGIPYPTYFHPSTDEEVLDWQDRVTKMDRKSLFCFAGAPRPTQDSSIRSQIMSHCKTSSYCNLLECEKSAGKCHSPVNVMRLFKESHFCLQPPGDSYTRRSMFDSILAGCIPVFFHQYSAYTQYGWHLPANHSSYSVFINEDFVRAENVSIEEVLRRFSHQQLESMRKVVISLIPHVIYGHPENNFTFKDAFDRSLDGVLNIIRDYQRSLELKLEEERRQEEEVTSEINLVRSQHDARLRAGAITR